MRSRTIRFAIMLAVTSIHWACGQTDTVIVDVSGSPDTLVVAGRVDTAAVTTADTMVSPPDTVIVTTLDTVFTPTDTVVVTRLDTVFSPADTVIVTRSDTVFSPPDTVVVTTVDTVVSGTDTTIVTTFDTVVSVDTVEVTTVDTVVTIDTVEVTTVDTVVTIDTVVVTRADTIVTVDTVIVVDTISVSTTLVASVSALNLRIGQSATLTVTTQNPLGFPSVPSNVTWVSDAPTIASVNSSGVVQARAVGQAMIFALASGLSASVPTTVTDSASMPPPPSGTPLVVFHSDWSTALGTSDAALRDTGKPLPWTERKDNSGGTQIVTASSTGLTWPTGLANVMRIMNLAAGSPLQGVRLRNAFTGPTVGQTIYYRAYFANTTPDSYNGDNSIHPWQDGPAGGNDNNWWWVVESTTRGTWRPEFHITTDDALLGGGAQIVSWVLGRASSGNGAIELAKDSVYGFEFGMEITGANAWHPHVRVYDVGGNILYDDSDWYRGNGNGDTLADLPTFRLYSLTNTASMQLGSNGWSVDPPQNYQAFLWGGMAICLNDWCGPYQNGR